MILLLLAIFCAFLLYFNLAGRLRHWQNLGVQGPKPKFLFGNLYDILAQTKSLPELVKDFYLDFKSEKYFGFYQFYRPILIVNNRELIKQITIKDFDHFTDHMNHAREDVDPLWSRNVFSMTGDRWKDMRATLSPAFTSSKMRMMFGLISEVAEGFVERMLARDEGVCTLEVKDTFTRITNDVIASCAVGVKCDSMGERNNEFYLRARNAFDFSGFKQAIFFLYSTLPQVMKLLGLKMFSDDTANFFRKVIRDTISERKEKNIIRPDMIHLLLEAQKSSNLDNKNAISAIRKKMLISDEDITAQALIFFFGGFDSSAILMCFLAYELAVNADVQAKLREEIKETAALCNGKVTYEAVMQMSYLDMVVSEALRKWPPASLLDRICTREYVIRVEDQKDLVMKPGSTVWIPTIGIHRDPDIYPDPDRFDPERFNLENRAKIDVSTYLPFGLGPRNCIGSRFALLETKAVICNVLKHFEIVPVKGTVVPLVISKTDINISAEGGIWLGLKRS